jgi:DNA-binding transcriptional regulator/RsmH inhibitor MraZ
VLFTGQSEITIDAKQRLAIPAKFRGGARSAPARTQNTGGDGASPESDPQAWYCVPWPVGSLLRLYPEDAFHRLAQSPDDSLIPNQDLADFEASFFGAAERLEQDKSGRVRLPKWHLDLVGMPSEVIVVGARNRLEIRDRATWLASQGDRFQQLTTLMDRMEARNRATGG